MMLIVKIAFNEPPRYFTTSLEHVRISACENHVLRLSDITEFIGQCWGGNVLIGRLDCRNLFTQVLVAA